MENVSRSINYRLSVKNRLAFHIKGGKRGRELDFIRQKNIISQGLRSTVKQFFLKDDASRVVTGKKNSHCKKNKKAKKNSL